MSSYATGALALVLIAAVIVGGGWIWLSLWNECRADHSWLYCMHFMGSR